MYNAVCCSLDRARQDAHTGMHIEVHDDLDPLDVQQEEGNNTDAKDPLVFLIDVGLNLEEMLGGGREIFRDRLEVWLCVQEFLRPVPRCRAR